MLENIILSKQTISGGELSIVENHNGVSLAPKWVKIVSVHLHNAPKTQSTSRPQNIMISFQLRKIYQEVSCSLSRLLDDFERFQADLEY